MLTLGTHQLGLSYQGATPIQSVETITIAGPSTVTASYVSHQDSRVGGWLLFWGSLLVGGAVMGASFGAATAHCASPSSPCLQQPGTNPAVLATGIGIVVGGVLTSLFFILQHDEAHVVASP